MSSFCTLWLCFLPPPPSRYLWSLYLVHLSLCRSSHPWWHPHQACWKAHRSAPWWSFQHHISQLNSRTRRKKMTTARVQDWRGEGGGDAEDHDYFKVTKTNKRKKQNTESSCLTCHNATMLIWEKYPFSSGMWTSVKYIDGCVFGFIFFFLLKVWNFHQIHMTDLSLITHLCGIVIWYFGNVKTSGKLSIITQKQNKKTNPVRKGKRIPHVSEWRYRSFILFGFQCHPFSVACLLHSQQNITLDSTVAMYYLAVCLVSSRWHCTYGRCDVALWMMLLQLVWVSWTKLKVVIESEGRSAVGHGAAWATLIWVTWSMILLHSSSLLFGDYHPHDVLYWLLMFKKKRNMDKSVWERLCENKRIERRIIRNIFFSRFFS